MSCAIHHHPIAKYCVGCNSLLCSQCILHQDHQLISYILYEEARQSFTETHMAKIYIRAMLQLKSSILKAINAAIIKFTIQSTAYSNFIAQETKLQSSKDILTKNLLKVITPSAQDPKPKLEGKLKALIDSIEELSHSKNDVFPKNNAIIGEESAIYALQKEALIWTPEYMDLIYGPMAPFIRNSIKQENITVIANPGKH